MPVSAGFAPGPIINIYDVVENHEPSLRRGGIVAAKSGYHSSRRYNKANHPGNYSIIAPADKRGDPDAARAIDLSLGQAGMIRVTKRLIRACKNNDPRIECVREVIGTTDGRTVVAFNRYDSGGSGSRSKTGVLRGKAAGDSTHIWHIHVSFFTDRVLNAAEMRGVIDVILGIPLEPQEAPEPEPEDWSDMATKSEIEATMRKVVREELSELLKNSVTVPSTYRGNPEYYEPDQQAWFSTAIGRIWKLVELTYTHLDGPSAYQKSPEAKAAEEKK